MTQDDQIAGLFDDGKDPSALRTIGEAAAMLGIKQHVLRYWEQQFTMLRPLKRSGGRRYYRPADLALLAQINQLINHQGYTLRGARLSLEANLSAAPAATGPAEPAPSFTDPASDLLPQLRAIRSRLAAALAV